jgi:hypothetical protein
MAAPKNNLDELRRLQSGGKPVVTAPVSVSGGASKVSIVCENDHIPRWLTRDLRLSSLNQLVATPRLGPVVP